ncbi:MAG: hypothetical protein ABFC94_14040 [Syntrophomonas sp.]
MNVFLKIIRRLWVLLCYRFHSNRIIITRAVLCGDGSIADIRYWLSRPDKVDPSSKVYLIHQDSGTRLDVLRLAKIGLMKTNHAMLAQTGVVLFRNRDNVLTPGCKVSLIWGKLKAYNIEIL